MAGKTYTQKIQFQSSFDGAEVLSGLKKIRQSMSNAGADASLFKGVDKDIAQAEKLVTDLLAQIQKGFSNPKEIANFEKQFEKLGSSLSKINVGLQGVNEAGNFNLNAAEIQKYTKELDKLTTKQGQLEQAAKDSIAAQLDAAKLSQKERQAIMDEVEAQGDLEAAIKKVAQAKEKAAKAKHGTKAMEEGSGREYIDTKVDVGLTADDVGATAKKGNVKRGKNDARARDAAGNLIKSDGKNQIDELKTNIALQESYKKALEEVVRTGGTADDAVELMKKSMGEYGIELTETTQLLYNFQHEIEDFYTDNLSSQQHAAITRAQSLGRTNIDGQFELSQQGQEIVDNADMQAAQQNLGAIRQAQEQVNAEIQEGERATEQFVQEQTQGLQQAQRAQENLEESTKDSTEKMKEQSEAAEAVNNKFDDMKQAVKTFLSIGSAISAVRNVISQTFNDIKELDKSFANIAMVTDYTVGQMWDSYSQYAQMANELGQSTQSVIEASGLFYQQGLDTAESLALTEDTMKLATLAGTDFAEATSQMTAALRGFKMEMDEGARVTDVYSELAAKAAADVQGIAYAMSKTASIAESAGMEFETTSAFLTQMIETTQEAPENIGTAMKTIIARFTELKTNVAGTTDSEFEDLDYNKVDTALKSVGVSIKDASGQFRDLDDVFLELSGKWNTLDRNTQRYIATIAAGSRQQSRFIAMMDNYERTMELVDTAYNSAGKSSEQFGKYQDTIEYKLNKLQNSWEQLRVSFFNSEGYGNAIELLTKLLDKIGEFDLIDFAVLGTVWLTLGKTMIQNLIKGMQSASTGITKAVGTIFNKIKNVFMSNVVPLQLSPQRADAQIEALRQRLQRLEAEKIELDADPSGALSDLQLIQQQLDALQADASQIQFGGGQAGIQGQGFIQDAEGNNMSEERVRAALNAEERRQQLDADIDVTDSALGDMQAAQQSAQLKGQAIGQVMGAAITMGITTAVAEDDPIQAVGAVLMSTLPMVISSLISMVTAGGGAISAAAIASTAGIMAIVMAITAAITGLVVWLKSNSAEKEANKLTNQIDALNDKIEETEEKIQQTKSSLNELSETGNTLEDLKEKWEELGSKQTLTTEEQEEYNSLVEQIKDEYPELITYYDEENNKIQISVGLLNEKIEKQNELIKAEQQLLNLQQKQLNSQVYDRDKKQIYKDLTEENRLFDKWTADNEEKYFEGALDLFTGKENKISLNNDSIYNSAEDLAGAYFESQLSGIEDSTFISDQASAMASQYMNIAEIAGKRNISIEEVLKDKDTLNVYLADAGLGDYATDENGEFIIDKNGEFVKDATEMAEAILENKDALQGFSEQVANATAAMKQVETENFKRQTDLNAEIVAQELGIDVNSAAANIIGAQAAALTSEMDAVTLAGEGDGVAAELDDLNNAMGDYADDIEFTVDEFKTLSDGVTQGHWAGANWEHINSSQRDNLKLLGIDADIWKDEYQDLDDAELSKKLAEAYSDYAQNAIAAIIGEEQEEKAEELNKAFTGLYSEIPEMTIDELNKKKEEFKTQYGESLSDEQWEQTWNEMTNNDVLSAAMENLAASGLEQQIIDSLSTSSVQYFSGMLDGLSLTDFGRSGITDVIGQISENYELSNKQLETLMSIDLSQGYHEIQRNSQTYIDALIESGMSLSEATEAFNGYINNIGSILGNAVLGKEGASVVKDMLQEDIKGFKSQYEPLIEARNEMLENEGTISSDTYFSLIEAGFEDYVEITTNGYELIADKAEEAWTAQAMAPLEKLREDIKLNKQLLDDAQKMSEEDWSITYWEGNSDMSISSVDSAISQYIENEKKFEGATEQLTDAQKRYIEAIVTAGYTTEEEYIKALQEGTVALEDMEPDTWIQGLINLQKASKEAAEKVNDLKDELVDLKEQLIEDKKAVDEAAQALHEAKFGTEDFQSGLDGLINYDRPLELINKQLENLKENLTDVSNIEDASSVMNQIVGLYEDKMVTLQAEGKVINQSLANLRQELLANYSDYISFDENGLAKVDFSYEDMQDNDIIKTDGLEKLIEEYNSTYDMALDKEQEYLNAQKEFDELKSEARDKYITMEQNVIDIIKEQMQEEIDAVTDKYAALEEADNNYLDALQEAVDKQRELRDQENQYEDLATKEKKLALMQRDTSGANKKEVISLEQEIKDDRQNLLDNEIDNLIDSMKELYDKQKEARDLEIEAMEAATENMQLINETALNIISGFTNIEDYQSWLLENDSSVKDMTVAQTEQYLEKAKEDFSGYAQYVSLTTEEIKLKTDEINQKADEMFTNTSENITDIGIVIQDAAEKAKQEAIDDAQEAYDEAVEKMDETQKKIAETKDALDKAEDAAVIAHGAAMDEMVKASESAMLKVATAGAEMMIEAEALDLSNSQDVQDFAKTHSFYNEKTGEYSRGFVDALTNKGYDTSSMVIDKQWQITGTPISGGPTIYLPGTFNTKAEAEAVLPEYLNEYSNSLKNLSVTVVTGSEATGAYKKYANGGLVNYTGPAWVDGTPNKPEAFLSAEDTARIGAAAKLLSDLPIFNKTSNAENAVSTNIGDTSIEIHINVENISDDYDVDQMIERIKQDIVDVAKPIGTSVILNK